jgi:3-dehydrosphinganine reductase
MKASPFAGKRVVLTGGSSGIGRSLAVQLVQQGADLVLIARRAGLLEETAAELEKHRRHAGQWWEIRPADVGRREQIESVLQELTRRHEVDLLINNAGVACAEYLDRTPPEVFEEMMRINYLGTVWTTRALVPHFQERRRGHIANVASLAGVVGFVGYAAYAPSKFAVLGLSEVLRNELRPFGIRVSVLLPGDTDTPQLEAENLTCPAETRAISGQGHPLRPDDVARAFLRGIAAGRYAIVPGLRNRLAYHVIRHAPGLTRWFLDRQVRAYGPGNRARG